MGGSGVAGGGRRAAGGELVAVPATQGALPVCQDASPVRCPTLPMALPVVPAPQPAALCPLPHPQRPGFTGFVSLADLTDPARGLMVNDTLRIKVGRAVARSGMRPVGRAGSQRTCLFAG